MLCTFRKHMGLAAVVALGLLVMGCCGWEFSASVRGRIAAHVDVARGHYRTLGYGLPVSWLPEYARLLRGRYGIEYRAVAGCIVSQSLIAYVEAYDAVSSAAAKNRFRHDVFRECAEDARTGWERRMAVDARRE